MILIKNMTIAIQKRPGTSLKGKPIVSLDGVTWYDPFGERILFNPTDLIYADKFWAELTSEKKENQKNIMAQNIIDAEKNGCLEMFVNPSGIVRDDKKRLSAYRVLAQQMGYQVGNFLFNPHLSKATAHLRKKEYLV